MHLKMFYYINSFKKRLFLFLFKESNKEEAKKFGLLSTIFFFIIGSYWIIRPLKNAILKDTAGVSSIPFAKKLSVLFIICLLLLYTKLVDKMSKQRLFNIVCSFYAVCFLLISFCLKSSLFVGQTWLGFVSYSLIESFGSLIVALFWAFVASTSSVSSAKRGYVFIFGIGQIGALIGTSLVTKTGFFGISFLLILASCGILVIPYLIKKFVVLQKRLAQLPKGDGSCDEGLSPKKNPSKKSAGLLEGVKLLATRPYVFGIFAVAMLYEVVVTIFDYQMQLLADQKYGTASYAAFNAYYGQLITLLALAFAALGTRFFIKRLGFRFCLIVFPSVVGVLLVAFHFFPVLWVALGSMVTIKALSYGFNNPVKEIIYIPTSDAIKFKAKSWIEMFGNRSSKAGGATINGFLSQIPQGFMTYGLIISISVVGLWFLVALFMGDAFCRLVKSKKIVS